MATRSACPARARLRRAAACRATCTWSRTWRRTEQLRRQDAELFYDLSLSITQAALGASVTVPTADGEEMVEIKPGTQAGSEIRLRGRGVPHLRRAGVRGDVHVLVDVRVPHAPVQPPARTARAAGGRDGRGRGRTNRPGDACRRRRGRPAAQAGTPPARAPVRPARPAPGRDQLTDEGASAGASVDRALGSCRSRGGRADQRDTRDACAPAAWPSRRPSRLSRRASPHASTRRSRQSCAATCRRSTRAAVDAAVDRVRRALGHLQAFELRPIGELHTRVVHEEDWAEAWKEHFPVLRVGRRLVIRPTWREHRPHFGRRGASALDPGMAFGTGLHPTTRLCLAGIETWADAGLVHGASVARRGQRLGHPRPWRQACSGLVPCWPSTPIRWPSRRRAGTRR